MINPFQSFVLFVLNQECQEALDLTPAQQSRADARQRRLMAVADLLTGKLSEDHLEEEYYQMQERKIAQREASKPPESPFSPEEERILNIIFEEKTNALFYSQSISQIDPFQLSICKDPEIRQAFGGNPTDL